MENKANSKLSELKSNPSNEKSGVWYEVCEGVSFKIKRAGGVNKEYDKAVAFLMKPFLRKNKTMSEKQREDQMRIFGEAFVKTCIVDWRGFPETPEPFTPALAMEELLKEEWHDLLNVLSDFASDPENFRNGEQELGND